MKQAERKAHKLALIQHLELLALELETRPGLDWGKAPKAWLKQNGRYSYPLRDYVRELGLPDIVLRMGRTRWQILPVPSSLRAVAKELGKLKIALFREWHCDELPDAVEWKRAA